MQTDILTQIVLPFSLFIIMLGMGLSLKPDDFSRVLKEPKAVTIGILCQMAILPLIGYVTIIIFGLTQELAVGLMILTFCPGGSTSNLMSYLSRGDVALSISLTAFISLVTPFSIPFFTALMMELFLDESHDFHIPIVKTIIQLLVITLVPVVVGMIIHKKYPQFSAKADKPVKAFSIVLLFTIIAAIVLRAWQDMADFFLQTGAASLTLNVVTLSTGYLIAKLAGLKKRQAITIGIEVGIQNGTVALLVAGTLLGSPTMSIPAVTYSLLMFVTGAIFGWLANRN